MSHLVYRPYHVITHHCNHLHVVDSFGAIVNRSLLSTALFRKSLCFCCLSDHRLIIFVNAEYHLDRHLYFYELTTFTVLKSVPFETSCIGLLQLRNTKIIVLTVVQGFHIYSNKLEFEQQVNHEGVLIECLCELPNGNIVTATLCQLHIWDTITWTELQTIDFEFINRFNNRLIEITFWKDFKLIGVTTSSDYFVYDLQSHQVNRIEGDNALMKSPIVLQNTFLWQHLNKLRMYDNATSVNYARFPNLDWLPSLTVGTHWCTFYDGRVLLQTTDEIIEFTENNNQIFTKLRTRRNVNEFRLYFAFHNKQDDDLLAKQLDPFMRDFIPIFDLRSILYSFI